MDTATLPTSTAAGPARATQGRIAPVRIEFLISRPSTRVTRDEVGPMASWVASSLIDSLGQDAVLSHSGRVVGGVGSVVVRLAKGAAPTAEQIAEAASCVGPHWSVETVQRG